MALFALHQRCVTFGGDWEAIRREDKGILRCSVGAWCPLLPQSAFKPMPAPQMPSWAFSLGPQDFYFIASPARNCQEFVTFFAASAEAWDQSPCLSGQFSLPVVISVRKGQEVGWLGSLGSKCWVVGLTPEGTVSFRVCSAPTAAPVWVGP